MAQEIKSNKKWLVEIDVLKAAAIVLIVFSHLHFYLNFKDAVTAFDPYIAEFGICLFIFTSGYTLYMNNHNIHTVSDIVTFYKKRVSRIIPLYWVAIIGFIIFFGALHFYAQDQANSDYSAAGIAINAFGLQAVLGHELPTMWFIGVILIYYVIYPVIMYFSKNSKDILLVSLVVVPILVSLKFAFPSVHYYLYLYYLVFISGILASSLNLFFDKRYERYMTAFPLLMLVALLVQMKLFNGEAQEFIGFSLQNLISTAVYSGALDLLGISFCVIAFLFVRSVIPLASARALKTISAIALGSYATFLFHEIFLSIFKSIYIFGQLNNIYSDIGILLIAFPFVFLMGYVIQSSYNAIEKALIAMSRSIFAAPQKAANKIR